jgi:Holliday junction resolvasome RuvABC endonuclease subunit
MVKLILGLNAVPTPHDAADALAVAICHINSSGADGTIAVTSRSRAATSWRHYRIKEEGRAAK